MLGYAFHADYRYIFKPIQRNRHINQYQMPTIYLANIAATIYSDYTIMLRGYPEIPVGYLAKVDIKITTHTSVTTDIRTVIHNKYIFSVREQTV